MSNPSPRALDEASRLLRTRRLLAGAFICASLFAAACQRGPSALDRLHACTIDEGPTDAYCGRYRVFEHREARAGRTIDLNIVVAPALRRSASLDPLFVFEGGPGGGAATLASERVPLFRRFQRDRDIVFVDQRGTGRSNRLHCSDDRAPDDFTALDDYPVERFRTCLGRLDADPRHYTTATAMDDIDEVRSFLGYGPINLWGGSYGTRAALVYLARHDASVRSVVLDGVAPPDMQLPLYMARDGQRALDRLLDDCERSPACAADFPALREALATVWRHVADRPVVQVVHPRTGVRAAVPLSRRMVAAIVFRALYSPEASSLLPQLLVEASLGRYEGLLALAAGGDQPDGAHSDGLFLSVVCAEDLPQIDPRAIEQEADAGFLGRLMFETQVKPCEFWPRGEVPAAFYRPVTSARPVLIFSGENDPVTPPSWGDRVAASLPHARHVIVKGAGHITLTRGCVPQLVAQFLETASTERLDDRCLQTLTRPPFFARPGGRDRPDGR